MSEGLYYLCFYALYITSSLLLYMFELLYNKKFFGQERDAHVSLVHKLQKELENKF